MKLFQNWLKEGYVVVQRDKQTRGKQQFNIFDSDQGNGSYDSNDAGMRYSGYLWATLNYYVFLKKAGAISSKLSGSLRK